MVAMSAIERPLSAEEDLLHAFLELSTPEGYRAELIDGEIIVTPPPDGSHETAIALLVRQLMRKPDTDFDALPNKGLITPNGRFIPDGTVTPVGHFENAEPWTKPAGVLLVFEITSTRPAKDREAKRLGYAAAEIPCYLLVDRSESKVTLFTDPEKGDYTAISQVAFGKPLDLPAPFSFTLDTGPLQ